MTVSIHWFRRDLRLTDNPALAAARAQADQVYGVYCISELDGLNPRQRSFAVGCLKQLRLNLEHRDATLTLLDGPADAALAAAALRLGATTVHAARAYSGAELSIERAARDALQRSGIGFETHRGHAVLEPDAVAGLKASAQSDGYRV